MRTYEEVVEEMTNTEEVAKAVLEANIADFIRELEKRGHVHMEIYFVGGGDSGELEWIVVVVS